MKGLTFAYSTDATDLTTGTFTAVPALNFSSPGDACSATQNVATDGNSANCRRLISFTITGVTIPNGQSFWIRWTDVDTGGSDDGVGDRRFQHQRDHEQRLDQSDGRRFRFAQPRWSRVSRRR